jgi:hypothetical protein
MYTLSDLGQGCWVTLLHIFSSLHCRSPKQHSEHIAGTAAAFDTWGFAFDYTAFVVDFWFGMKHARTRMIAMAGSGLAGWDRTLAILIMKNLNVGTH